MNIRAFVATIAITAAAALAPSANAFTSDEQRLFTALENAGVSSTIGECETDRAYGFYVPSENRIHICDNVATTTQQQWETLRHEAVHAAQRCVNPSMAFTVTTSQFLMANGRQSDWSFIQEAYDREDWAIELEAFTLMRSSNSEIANLVSNACG